MPTPEPNYGIDAPPVVFTFTILGVIFFFAGVFIGSGAGLGSAVGPWGAAIICLATAGYMVRSSLKAKPALWAQMLDDLDLGGGEHALDVGCGRGLVTVELAKRLPQGKVTGIDIWRAKDQSGNRREATELNIDVAGVGDRVEIVDADVAELPFPDQSFDLVTASLAIHNIAAAADRAAAMTEIMRVVRPGGRIVILDIAKTQEYTDAIESDGRFEDVDRSSMSFAIYPPVRTVTARRPLRGARRKS